MSFCQRRLGQALETCNPRSRGCFNQARLGSGGARRDRTDDLMLAKHALYQLSYGPNVKPLSESCRSTYPPEDPRNVVGPGGLEPPTSRLSGVCSNQLSYRPLKRHVPTTRSLFDQAWNTRSHHSLIFAAAVFCGKRNEDGDVQHLCILLNEPIDRSLEVHP
jgi:hypothetical protein